MTADYKSTLSLPKTDFPMRAGLAKLEPRLLRQWQDMDLYAALRAQSKGREAFVLHDGPPYANGNIHMGHALNKILKDVINRSQQMMGKDANYVPGWDCHGLPIEWKIEERYREAGRDKDAVPIVEFRRECREFAEHWIDVQRDEFKRLGVIGDWDHPYTTMTYAAEARIVGECLKFLMSGGLYRGAKPVMWSVVEKTALAEAEIEYHDHVSTTVYVRFPVIAAGDPALDGAAIAIWTTTPWTMPGNRAISFGPRVDYRLIEVTAVAEGSLAKVGERLAVAEPLLAQTCADAGIAVHKEVMRLSPDLLAATVCAHPWRGRGYDFDVPLFAGDHVTTDQGTGFVHTAPGHGADDYEVGVAHGLEVPHTVDGDGNFFAHVPLFAGRHVFEVDDDIAAALADVGALLAKGSLRHSYPHSWRSKAPLIFRNTDQWFISMTINELRKTALESIDRVRWVPASGRNRIYAMISERPDWVVSRQRAWGVPITVFVDKTSGEPLRDEAVNARIIEAVHAGGADAWFASPADRFLAPDYAAEDFEMVHDILDVWFDSGSTHGYVLEDRADLSWPASLYLEGSDQHRGWFHSSLLVSCGTRGRAPYDAVLTHGFLLNERDEKMSKSAGNAASPQEIWDHYGADILRQWVVSADYTMDLRIGTGILDAQSQSYRRLRNTLRFILGNLHGFEAAERIAPARMPELDRWVLHRLHELDGLVRRCCNDFDFHRLFVSLYTFCTVDLSAVYFDIRKDALYCDLPGSVRRRAARTVLDELFRCLTIWLAPVLCFTAEEVWQRRRPGESVHLETFPELPADWRDDELAARWDRLRTIRRAVTGALEVERQEKRIGASLAARPTVFVGAADAALLRSLPFDEICITSGIEIAETSAPDGAFRLEDVGDVAVVVGPAAGARCARCWQVLPSVGADPAHRDLCQRCGDAVAQHALTAA